MPSVAARLMQIDKFGSGIGLHRLQYLCDELFARPWGAALDVIRVTGSNGKGSVCAMTEAILRAGGLSTGLYTSPHLFRFHERIQLNGEAISDEELEVAYQWFTEKSERYRQAFPEDRFGAFEVFTALAMRHFSDRQPQVVVAEAGIGGRFDATRIVPGRIVGLTTVDLEHTKLLGDSLELIAYDKSELCPPGGTLVLGRLPTDITRRVSNYAKLRGVNVVGMPETCEVSRVDLEPTGMVLDANVGNLVLHELRTNLVGSHQVDNALTSILLAKEWLDKHQPEMTATGFCDAVTTGLSQVHWPGRFQRVQQNPDVYIDVGHSPAAVDCLVETVKRCLSGKNIVLVTGVSHDKRADEIVSRLIAITDHIICTRACHRGGHVSDVVGIARRCRPEATICEADTIDAAIHCACEVAIAEDMTVLVAGGLFLAIEAAEVLRGGDPRKLEFF